MARNVIVLERLNLDPSGDIRYRYALWASVPVARRSFYANAAFVSEVKGAEAPTNQENTDLRNGVIVERTGDASFPAGTSLADIRASLQTNFTAYQAEVNASPHPWDRYGTNWDATTQTWTNKTVS